MAERDRFYFLHSCYLAVMPILSRRLWHTRAKQKMTKSTIRLVVAFLVGLLSELMPIPGLLAAAIVFPQSIHSDHGIAYLVPAACLNFALFFAASYYAFGRFSQT